MRHLKFLSEAVKPQEGSTSHLNGACMVMHEASALSNHGRSAWQQQLRLPADLERRSWYDFPGYAQRRGRALVEVGQVVAQDVTEAAEFCGALVGEAELESVGGRHGIQRLQAAVVPQDVEHAAVRLPQELEPGRDLLPISPILRS